MPFKSEQKAKEWKKNYYLKNRDKILKICKEWKIKNTLKEKERRKKWRKENPEKYKAQQQRWRQRYPEKLQFLIEKRRARENNLNGSHTLKEWQELKKKYNYCCAICGMQEPFTDQWHKWLTEDHIIPISKEGTNYIENIQPLCQRCNSKKYNKVG